MLKQEKTFRTSILCIVLPPRSPFRLNLRQLKLSSCILIFGLLLTSPAQQNPDSDRIHAQIQRIEEALSKITDRGAALFLKARLYIRLGDLNKALALMKECVAMDQGFDPDDRQDFKALDSNPEFQKLVEQVHRRQPPVHRAQVAYTVQEATCFLKGWPMIRNLSH